MTDEYESVDRNPNNKFFGCLTHADQVNDTWGCGLSFSCGIIVLSILIGFSAIYDIFALPPIFRSYYFRFNLFYIVILLRILSDFITIAGIIYAYISICNSDYKKSLIAYYCLMVSFIIDVSFSIYITIIYIFFYNSYFYHNSMNIGTFISWIIDVLIFYLFVWFLFCNSVVIKRKGQGTINNGFLN